MSNTTRNDILKIFHKGLDRVRGRYAVREYLKENPCSNSQMHLVAIGKAAGSMTLGALDVLGKDIVSGILITKREHVDDALKAYPQIMCLESDHPVPSEASLQAGKDLIDYLLQNASPDKQFLFLLSGGASSLVEVLIDDYNLEKLQHLTELLLSHGYDIQQMNKVRRAVSKIKGGRLAAYLNGAKALVLLMSDVPGDNTAVIGSGLLTAVYEDMDIADYESEIRGILRTVQSVPVPPQETFARLQTHIIARLDDAKQACLDEARKLGYRAKIVERFVEGDTSVAASTIVQEMLASNQMLIYGGETSLTLPPDPGKGGRNQHLALCAALLLEGKENAYLLAAGTDGTDGPTDAAGAIVDGSTVSRGKQAGFEARLMLKNANSYEFLQASDDLIMTGPTGTNVMDLVITVQAR